MLTLVKKVQEFIPSTEYEVDDDGEYILDNSGNKQLTTDQPVTFLYKPATFGDTYSLINNSKIKQKGSDSEIEQNNMGDYLRSVLIKCLVGWKNIVDEDGKEIPFDSKKKNDMVDMLPMGIANEIAFHILNANQSGEDEEKN